MKKLSIVVPCYNEEESILAFYKAINHVQNNLQDLSLEILFVDDGSIDNTLQILKKLRNSDERVHYISFSRNFGKESALLAGLKHVTGDYIVTMDVDLQDPPFLLPEMYQYIIKGYDCVATRRVTRKGEPLIRSFFARTFYKIMHKISKVEIIDGARDYRFMTRQMVDSIISIKEYNRFIKGIYGWVGYNTKWIEYKNIERTTGETKWSFWKLFIYSIEGIVAFSTVPLAAISIIGILFCILTFFSLIFLFLRALLYGDPVAGWPSLICAIMLLGSIQLLCLGIVGLYISKIYLEVKQRPNYIIKEKE